ncbi:Uncharacterized membrane protein YcaP, DUF421 family [Natronincola peptidivorans]|uniref:Uncharacterized membrane protein YcaP, DUF421 family n=1 Tax=Natronincola peptidivorans TaxID=426128 RepID=A0A1I0ALX0_9FIRM|nr:DUF421 domain-containing protein [Natronincola peptidivorans]SES95293.1 Uncharacterized membrane protein YcaP, DUF421 family [Natronincola peptidivorans]
MQDYLTIFLRIITILPLLLLLTVYIMGKRPIGELPVFDFLVIITMGSVVGADIADPDIEHMPTIFAIIILALLQNIVSRWVLKHRRFGRFISFEPTLIIENGRFIVKNIKDIKYSIDEVLMMLREKDIFNFNDVKYAIVESNGKLTVLKKTEVQPLTPKDMSIIPEEEGIPTIIVLEGRIDEKSLDILKLSREDIITMIKQQGYTSTKEIFLATYSTEKGLVISPYKGEIPPINLQH